MTVATDVCSSIEGRRIRFSKCRKFFPHLPRINQELDKRVYPFKISIYGQARIEQAIDQKLPVYASSLITEDDEIRASSIDGFSTKLVSPEIKQGTGRHKGTFFLAKGYAYAHIDVGLRDLLARKSRK